MASHGQKHRFWIKNSGGVMNVFDKCENVFDKYEFELETITPIIMSGADQQKFEWRSQSTKGLMRWWFRVAGGSREDEEKIFGSGGEKANASKVRIRTDIVNKREKVCGEWYQNLEGEGIRYLGYSLRGSERKMIFKGRFKLIVMFPRIQKLEDMPLNCLKKKVFATLWLMVSLGNFGTRARRGFGSMRFVAYPNEIKEYGLQFDFSDKDKIEEWIKNNLKKIESIIPNTAGLKFTVWYLEKNWDEFGKIFKEERKQMELKDRLIFGAPLIQYFPRGRKTKKFCSNRKASQLIVKPYPKNVIIFTVIHNPNLSSIPEDHCVRKHLKDNVKRIPQEIENFLRGLQAQRIYP